MRDYNHDGKIDKYDYDMEELEMEEWNHFCENNKENPSSPIADAITMGIIIGIIVGFFLYLEIIL